MTLNLIFAKPISIEPSQNIQTLLSASLNTVKYFLHTLGGFHLYLSELAFINQFYSIMTRLVGLSLAND